MSKSTDDPAAIPYHLHPESLHEWIDIGRHLAERAHEGQTRRGGAPYLTHPAAVAASVPSFLKPIAWLHDACEDSPLTATNLTEAGLPKYVVDAVVALSRLPGEGYNMYLARVLRNPLASAVKCADIAHNLSENPNPTTRDQYLSALPKLVTVATSAWPEIASTLTIPAAD